MAVSEFIFIYYKQTCAYQTKWMWVRISLYLLKIRPDLTSIQEDTCSLSTTLYFLFLKNKDIANKMTFIKWFAYFACNRYKLINTAIPSEKSDWQWENRSLSVKMLIFSLNNSRLRLLPHIGSKEIEWYSGICLKRTLSVQKNLSASDRCPLYREFS